MLTNTFKANYSVGAIANGIKTDTFTFFLLFFYSRVIGLDPLLASLAIGLALFIDSLTDPLIWPNPPMGHASTRMVTIQTTQAVARRLGFAIPAPDPSCCVQPHR